MRRGRYNNACRLRTSILRDVLGVHVPNDENSRRNLPRLLAVVPEIFRQLSNNIRVLPQENQRGISQSLQGRGDNRFPSLSRNNDADNRTEIHRRRTFSFHLCDVRIDGSVHDVGIEAGVSGLADDFRGCSVRRGNVPPFGGHLWN